MEYNYCRRCGSELNSKKPVIECSNGHHVFPSASPTTGVFFIRNNKIVLSLRAEEPNKGTLDTIGGFVDLNENFEQAIEREIFEETGLSRNQYGNLTYLCSGFGAYEYQSENRQVLSVFFTAKLDDDAEMKIQDDISGIEELNIYDISEDSIGNEDVKKAFKTLKKVIKL